ncbi:MAG: hypothetical protein ABI056_08605 [Caulobacteraceae bacterium]
MGLILQFALPSEGLKPGDPAVAMSMPRLVAAPSPLGHPVVLLQPIFSPDRKAGEDADAAPGASALDGYAALGVAMARGLAAAVVKGADGAVKTLKLGADLEGWRLVAIDRNKVTFQKNDAHHVLSVGAPAQQPGQDQGQAPAAQGQAGAQEQ